MKLDWRTKHGMTKSPEYQCWRNMRHRCENKNDQDYHSYGGRGIRVCAAWSKSFEQFIADVGRRPSPDHTLDRYPDNDGNYEPGNVRWALPAAQNRNRRGLRIITLNGRSQCLGDWAAEIGIHPSVLLKRMKRWTLEDALTTPKLPGRRHQ